jgi:hypothetical protein
LIGLVPEGRTDFRSAFRASTPRLNARGLAIVISDFYDHEGYRLGLRFLKHRGMSVYCIHVVDEAEVHPGLIGRLNLHDVETGGSRRAVVTADLLTGYERALAHYLKEVESFCYGSEIGYSRVPTTVPFDRAVLTILREGGILR